MMTNRKTHPFDRRCWRARPLVRSKPIEGAQGRDCRGILSALSDRERSNCPSDDMLHQIERINQLLREDRRYRREAYAFVFEALNYAQEELGFGREIPGEPTAEGEPPQVEKHITGAELCEAVRQLAIKQFGLMAKTVLNSWGIRSTSDLGEIVFNLIRIEQMRKTPEDRREDFDEVFDFDEAFRQSFAIEL